LFANEKLTSELTDTDNLDEAIEQIYDLGKFRES